MSTETENTGEALDSSQSQLRRLIGADAIKSMPFWLLPAFLVGLFIYGAVLWNFVISLTDLQGFGTPSFSQLDFDMYGRAFSDPQFLFAGQNTIVLLVVFTIVCLVLGLGLAILLDQDIRRRGHLRTIYLLPFSLAFIVTGQVWLWMYNYNYGVVNTFTRALGLGQYQIIGNSQIILGAIITALAWQFVGYTMVVYLAGLRTIPDDQFEAARVAGVKDYRIYWKVIIPQLKASAASAGVILMVFALKTFDFLFAMFGQYRPQKGADILATMMVREAFQKLEWAYGASIAVILFLMALGIISPYIYYQYKVNEI
ncbi:carbohydrate ABC transporter permease [Haloarcula salina]|uniref:Sugar ABC transporter permease n=1 Tax=Haloarcula salina TaxID=1429914 RepID=A0AA41GB41_9EURY|nr:sugar ABC transporter permease [Haloarcula salina]MBV0903517.1 sugar ABC transporter permease [Haloarcula salina]